MEVSPLPFRHSYVLINNNTSNNDGLRQSCKLRFMCALNKRLHRVGEGIALLVR